MPAGLNVAIIGAGMGGLAAAAALRKAGIDGHGLRAGAAVHAAGRRHPDRLQRHACAARPGAGAASARRDLLSALVEQPRLAHRRGAVRHAVRRRAEQKYGAPYLLAHRGDLHAALASIVPAELVHLDHAWSGSTRRRTACGSPSPTAARSTADAVVAPTASTRWCARRCSARRSRISPAASPIARSIRPSAWPASTWATAPNGGARTATS